MHTEAEPWQLMAVIIHVWRDSLLKPTQNLTSPYLNRHTYGPFPNLRISFTILQLQVFKKSIMNTSIQIQDCLLKGKHFMAMTPKTLIGY